MAATIARTSSVKWPEGKRRAHTITVLGDTSYPTGGYAIAGNDAGMTTIMFLIAGPCFPTAAATTAYIPVWDQANGKLKLYWSTTGVGTALVEVTAATDVSTATFQAFVIGV